MSGEKVWPCQHIYLKPSTQLKWAYDVEPYFKEVPSEWQTCPICGASRPPAKKRLAQIIGESYDYQQSDWSCEAKAALTWFLGVVEGAEKTYYISREDGNVRLMLNAIKERLAEEGA